MFSFFRKSPRIEVFVRHCHFSSVSQHKERFPSFTRERCHENLMQTIDRDLVGVTFLLDSFHPLPENQEHFIRRQNRYPVIEIKEGTEAGSFLKLLSIVSSLKLPPETVVYFLEDDYVHRPGWIDILLEGFSLPGIDYVTLYDHQDKYFSPDYETLASKVLCTSSCHWRTTPSTTNTYAMKFKTLMRDFEIHREFSLHRKVSSDHDKFCKLGSRGAKLISPIPGWSTHAEPRYASPCVNWEHILLNLLLKEPF